MKKARIWLLWVGVLFLASTAFSQSQFITAGQIQGMTVTHFIPDSVLIVGNPQHFQIDYDLVI